MTWKDYFRHCPCNTRDRGRIRRAPTPGYAGPMQDPNYKRLFSSPRMVEDLLRAFLPEDALAELDFSTLAKLPAEYVSDELLKLRRHRGDRRPLRVMFALMLQHQAHCPIPHFRGVSCR